MYSGKEYREFKRIENKATKRRRLGQKKGMVCRICGKGYYEHKDYIEILEHEKLSKGRQWIKLS